MLGHGVVGQLTIAITIATTIATAFTIVIATFIAVDVAVAVAVIVAEHSLFSVRLTIFLSSAVPLHCCISKLVQASAIFCRGHTCCLDLNHGVDFFDFMSRCTSSDSRHMSVSLILDLFYRQVVCY